MHAVGSNFGGVIRSESKGEFCRLKVRLDVRRPLQRGVFISTKNLEKVWLPFKYENLPVFYFGCGRMGHGVKDYL